jgi:peptidyl-tRNA hydrolase
MSPGKAASQAAHAALDTFVKSPQYLARAYLDSGGTKVVLVAKNEAMLRAAFNEAERRGLPCALVVESGHVMLPSFDGSPIVTAIGIGPALRDEMRAITDKFHCLK